MHAIVETDKLRVIPVALASDGTALKPRLEFDPCQKLIIGLVYKVAASYVKTHPQPAPQDIKENLVTIVDVSYLTSSDNGASMPAVLHYLPKSVSSSDMSSSKQDTVQAVQICERWLKHQRSDKHIIKSATGRCFSICNECLNSKSVCAPCTMQRKRAHIPYPLTPSMQQLLR